MTDEPSQSFFLKLKNLFSLSKKSEEVLKNTEPEDERIEELIENVLNIKDSIVKEIMIPKVNISFLTESDSLEDVYSVVNDTKHSRYPVFNSDKDKVNGILHVKDMLGSAEDKINLNTILREAKHVPESQSVTSLLEDFKKDKAHLAIVLDEYGVISGLITIEDILEEIVGEIEDEFYEEKK
jgi:magnesium and cobalt transporter